MNPSSPGKNPLARQLTPLRGGRSGSIHASPQVGIIQNKSNVINNNIRSGGVDNGYLHEMVTINGTTSATGSPTRPSPHKGRLRTPERQQRLQNMKAQEEQQYQQYGTPQRRGLTQGGDHQLLHGLANTVSPKSHHSTRYAAAPTGVYLKAYKSGPTSPNPAHKGLHANVNASPGNPYQSPNVIGISAKHKAAAQGSDNFIDNNVNLQNAKAALTTNDGSRRSILEERRKRMIAMGNCGSPQYPGVQSPNRHFPLLPTVDYGGDKQTLIIPRQIIDIQSSYGVEPVEGREISPAKNFIELERPVSSGKNKGGSKLSSSANNKEITNKDLDVNADDDNLLSPQTRIERSDLDGLVRRLTATEGFNNPNSEDNDFSNALLKSAEEADPSSQAVGAIVNSPPADKGPGGSSPENRVLKVQPATLFAQTPEKGGLADTNSYSEHEGGNQRSADLQTSIREKLGELTSPGGTRLVFPSSPMSPSYRGKK